MIILDSVTVKSIFRAYLKIILRPYTRVSLSSSLPVWRAPNPIYQQQKASKKKVEFFYRYLKCKYYLLIYWICTYCQISVTTPEINRASKSV